MLVCELLVEAIQCEGAFPFLVAAPNGSANSNFNIERLPLGAFCPEPSGRNEIRHRSLLSHHFRRFAGRSEDTKSQAHPKGRYGHNWALVILTAERQDGILQLFYVPLWLSVGMSISPSKSLRQVQLKRIKRAEEMGQPTIATQLREAYLRIYPDHVPMWVSYGVGLVELARYEEAREVLRHAIRLCPADHLSIPYTQMGHLYKQRGNLRRAALWYRKATVVSPTDADGYIYLGSVLALMGDLDGALKWHEQGARCASGCIEEAHHNAGLVLRAMGRYVEATRAFRRALKIDSAYAEAQRALRDVESALKDAARLLNGKIEPMR